MLCAARIAFGGFVGTVSLVVVGPALVAGASPGYNTPADCPTATVDSGSLPFGDPVPEFDALLGGVTFDCSFDPLGTAAGVPGVRSTDRFLLLENATYEQFVAVVSSVASAGGRLFDGGYSGGELSSVIIAEVDQFASLSGDYFNALAQFRTPGGGRVGGGMVSVGIQNALGFTSPYQIGLADGRTVSIDERSVATLIVSVLGYTAPASPVDDATTPSILSNLKTAAEAAPNVTQGGVIAGSAVALMLVVGYPGYLLSTVIAGRYDRWVGSRLARIRAAADAKPWRRRLLIGAGLVVASVITGFLDPEFGLNAWSLRLVLTAMAAFVVLNLGGSTVVRAVIRRLDPDAPATLEFRWGSVIILILAVVVCRLLSFDPGVIFGLVAGLTFGAALAQSRRAVVVLVGSGFAAVVGILSWIAYSLIVPIESAGNLGLISLKELFAALTIEGIATLPLALLPFASLDGAVLRAWKLPVWIAAYAVAAALFVFVLVSLPDSWSGVSGDIVRWAVIFAVFSVVAVGVWLLDTRPGRTRKLLPSVPVGDIME